MTAAAGSGCGEGERSGAIALIQSFTLVLKVIGKQQDAKHAAAASELRAKDAEPEDENWTHYDMWDCLRCGAYSGRWASDYDYDLSCRSCGKSMRLTSRRPRKDEAARCGVRGVAEERCR